MSQEITEWAEKKIAEYNTDSQTYTVTPIDDTRYTVQDGSRKTVVNLTERTYTCVAFQMDLLPCSHALAVLR